VADGARTTYTYDSNGSMTAEEDSNGTTSQSYDYEDRLQVVTYPDSSRTTFAYNGEGKRLSKQDSSGTVKYIYDMDKVVLERDGEDTTVAGYTHEGGGLYYDLISMKRTNGYYYLFDGLGSVSEVVDSNEATQNSYRYEAFGQVESSSENVTNPYRYVGAYGVHWDAPPALYFMRARYHMPASGRFITVDPFRGALQDPPSLDRYIYAANDPCNKIDPTGLRSWEDCMEDSVWSCMTDLMGPPPHELMPGCMTASICCRTGGPLAPICCGIVAACWAGFGIGWIYAADFCIIDCDRICSAEQPFCWEHPPPPSSFIEPILGE